MSVRPRPLAQRFWAKVEKTATCWEWTGATDRFGYGQIGLGSRGAGLAQAHRLSFELNVGLIPAGLCICHHCDNPRCVRPEHLFLGSRAENNRDMHLKRRNRQPRGEECWAAKLSAREAVEIRGLRGVESGPRVARRFGVDSGTIYRIWLGHSWKSAEAA